MDFDVSNKNMDRMFLLKKNKETFNGVLTRLLDCWDQDQKERDDLK